MVGLSVCVGTQTSRRGRKTILCGHFVDTIKQKGLATLLTPCYSTTFGCSESVILVQALFNTSCLTSTLTQVVQFSFTNGTTALNSDAVDNR
ncbi:Uncharacterised protein [Edwardsiella tarda]|nr:Uncharacterised protein [Edwardsiella tarda]